MNRYKFSENGLLDKIVSPVKVDLLITKQKLIVRIFTTMPKRFGTQVLLLLLYQVLWLRILDLFQQT